MWRRVTAPLVLTHGRFDLWKWDHDAASEHRTPVTQWSRATSQNHGDLICTAARVCNTLTVRVFDIHTETASRNTGSAMLVVHNWTRFLDLLYAFFRVIARRLNFICRRFGTPCLFHLHRRAGMKKVLRLLYELRSPCTGMLKNHRSLTCCTVWTGITPHFYIHVTVHRNRFLLK